MGGSFTLKLAAKKMVIACGSFSRRRSASIDPVVNPVTFQGGPEVASKRSNNDTSRDDAADSSKDVSFKQQELCAICLDSLSLRHNSKGGGAGGQRVFKAQCSHAFHLACISSNVRHGSVTCPVCRAHWSHLPRHKDPPPSSSSSSSTDPILQILDDSIATFRLQRRSFLRYHDPIIITPHHHHRPRLRVTLVPVRPPSPSSSPSPSSLPHCGRLGHPSASSSLLPLPRRIQICDTRTGGVCGRVRCGQYPVQY